MEENPENINLDQSNQTTMRMMPQSSTLLDILCEVESTNNDDHQKSSLEFIDMLNVQDFDDLLQDIMGDSPTTPNSCSVSSSSKNDQEKNQTFEEEEEGDAQEKTKKPLKPQKKNLKKPREPRFAFVTKSETDQLDDGYKWRKYGQKAVKNSSFPRSYYRCTTTSCGVKKRVERSSEDSSIIITTYEGTHTHTCPVTRSNFGILSETTTLSGIGGTGGYAGGVGGVSNIPQTLHYQHYQHYQPYFQNSPNLSFINGTSNISTSHPTFSQILERPFCPSASSSLARDDGLLQDMLPFGMLEKAKMK